MRVVVREGCTGAWWLQLARVMLRACLIVLSLGGCSLYFDDPPSSTPDASPSPSDTGGSSADRLQRPCIHTLVAGNLLVPLGTPYANDIGVMTYTCSGTAPVIETVADTGGGGIEGRDAESNYQLQFTRMIVEDIDGRRPLDYIAIFPPMMWIFSSGGGNRVTFDRSFGDLWIGDLDGDGVRDFVAADAQAIRISSAYSQTYGFPLEVTSETEILTGKPFRWFAVGDFGGSSARDLLYVADGGGQIELGLAIQTQANPLAFTTQILAQVAAPGVADPPLVVADIDGDGKPDVIGAHQNLWIYSTKAAALYTWPAHAPRALAGGKGEVIYADDGMIYRAAITGGVLHVDPLFADPAVDAIAVGDLDGNGHGDVLVVHGIDTMASEVVRYSR